MNRVVHILLLILAGLLVLIMVAMIAVVVTARRPFPDTDGAVTLNGLQDEVTIYRDEYGIPHIYANNVDDMFFAGVFIFHQSRQPDAQRLYRESGYDCPNFRQLCSGVYSKLTFIRV